MGPSDAGKDSLLDWLRTRIPAPLPVHWARRTISRSTVPGGEAHESMLLDAFAALRCTQALALHWEANGLGYGIRHAQVSPKRAMAFKPPSDAASIEVRNDRTLDDAGQVLMHALGQLAGWPVHSGKLSHDHITCS
jgi:hypothetical protein